MRFIVFTIEYTVSDFGWGRNPVPVELRSDCRIPLFCDLIKCANDQNVSLAMLPGGFFRTDFPAGIISALRHNPPEIAVLVGRDNRANNHCEIWVIAPSGRIRRKIPEAWIYKRESKRQSVLDSITDRRFQLKDKMYAVFCCGDVIIDERKALISKCGAAFVLAHYSAKGRNFTQAMRDLGIPVFLSHHVKYPYNTISFAYNGDIDLRPITELKGESQGLKWMGRVYSI